MKTLLLDTNAVMHYEFVDLIHWPTVVEAPHVLIVIHPELLRELNELKDARDRPKKTKERAAKVIKRFYELFEDGLVANGQQNVEMRFEANEPDLGIFTEYRLNAQFGDDCHLASAIKRQTDCPNESVLLVTHDIGVKLKARSKGIACADPPERHRLPEALDPLEKRNKELEEELASLNTQTPILRVCSDDGKEHVEIAKYSKEDHERDPRDEIKAELAHRTIRLDLQLVNTGRAPATDVDVAMQLPNGLRVLNEDQMRNLWEMPEDASFEQISETALKKRSGDRRTAQQRMWQTVIDGLSYTIFQDLVASRRVKPSKISSHHLHNRLSRNILSSFMSRNSSKTCRVYSARSMLCSTLWRLCGPLTLRTRSTRVS